MTTAISPARHQSRRGDASSMPAVAAAGTARRLRALMVMRWPAAELARRLGLPAQAVGDLVADRPLATPETAAAVQALYDELWDRPRPCERTRSRALARGWAPPMAWDDDAIDDPEAVPQGVADDAASRRGRVTAMVEDSEELLGQGYTLAQAAGRLGVSASTLGRARLRRGLRLSARRKVEGLCLPVRGARRRPAAPGAGHPRAHGDLPSALQHPAVRPVVEGSASIQPRRPARPRRSPGPARA